MTVVIKEGGPLGGAVDELKRGGVVAFPTETFYGLAVDPFNPSAVESLFRLKGRPEANPVALIMADVSMLGMAVAGVPPAALRLMEKFWPGPLTIVLPAAPEIPVKLHAGTGTIGVRVSPHPVATALSRSLGSPITATSANTTGSPPASSAEEVLGYFKSGIGAIVDGGTLRATKGSTIIKVEGASVTILREGAIPASEVMGI